MELEPYQLLQLESMVRFERETVKLVESEWVYLKRKAVENNSIYQSSWQAGQHALLRLARPTKEEREKPAGAAVWRFLTFNRVDAARAKNEFSRAEKQTQQ